MSLEGKLSNTENGLSTQYSCPAASYTWEVSQITNAQYKPDKYAVLILNRPITQSEKFLANFWNNALVRMTVDGGTKHWDSFVHRISALGRKNIKLPDLITGDFDSIPIDIFDKYKQKGCKTYHTPDQNHTDFTKALIELQKYIKDKKIDINQAVAFGQSSGRLDQVLGNIQTLYLVKEKQLIDPKIKVYLISDDAISWILVPGEHVIKIPKETRFHKQAWCSLVPIGETCKSVTTTGLKWNLDGQPLKFGDLVSTSNTFDNSGVVVVTCSHTLFWSMRIPVVSIDLNECI